MKNRNLIIKIGSYIGIFGSLLSVVLIFGSALFSSNWFSWTHNLLNDIGVRNDTAATLFNLTPLTSGFLFFIFGLLSLSRYLPRSDLNRVGLVVFSIGNILKPFWCVYRSGKLLRQALNKRSWRFYNTTHRHDHNFIWHYTLSQRKIYSMDSFSRSSATCIFPHPTL